MPIKMQEYSKLDMENQRNCTDEMLLKNKNKVRGIHILSFKITLWRLGLFHYTALHNFICIQCKGDWSRE